MVILTPFLDPLFGPFLINSYCAPVQILKKRGSKKGSKMGQKGSKMAKKGSKMGHFCDPFSGPSFLPKTIQIAVKMMSKKGPKMGQKWQKMVIFRTFFDFCSKRGQLKHTWILDDFGKEGSKMGQKWVKNDHFTKPTFWPKTIQIAVKMMSKKGQKRSKKVKKGYFLQTPKKLFSEKSAFLARLTWKKVLKRCSKMTHFLPIFHLFKTIFIEAPWQKRSFFTSKKPLFQKLKKTKI